MSSCAHKCSGPGYASPQEATKGPREKILFVTCAHTDATKCDALMVIDVDPQSETYSKVIGRLDFPHAGDEVHHFGWNACSSCHGDPNKKRSHLIVPCLNSSRIYIVDISDHKNPRLHKTIEPEKVRQFDVSFPHTAHCLANGHIMISTLGDANGNNKGEFLLLDGESFEPIGTWNRPDTKLDFNYDFWYQPRRNLMISTEWGSPNFLRDGFNPAHVAEGKYGNHLHVFNWTTRELKQNIELEGAKGQIPLEIRFHHEPSSPHGFVATALGSTVYHLRPKAEDSEEYTAIPAISVPSKSVSGWHLPEMPALITDILVSMDDRFLYFSNWLHGDIRQYDITNPEKPKLAGQLFIGGSIHTASSVTVIKDEEAKEPPHPLFANGKHIEGGPQMLQLSLDGRRLYVTTSLYRSWDEQFYPGLLKGAVLLQIDVDIEKGGLKLNENFSVDFGELEDGPFLAHEIRYPGGDCSSDIWI